jgi:hypothetical protein
VVRVDEHFDCFGSADGLVLPGGLRLGCAPHVVLGRQGARNWLQGVNLQCPCCPRRRPRPHFRACRTPAPQALTPRRLTGRWYVHSEPKAAHGPQTPGVWLLEHCLVSRKSRA